MTEIRESNACFRTVLKRYTVCFVLFCSFCLLSYFVIGRKSMFDETDGIHQQYMYYLYVGIWIRRLFRNIFVKHILEQQKTIAKQREEINELSSKKMEEKNGQ